LKEHVGEKTKGEKEKKRQQMNDEEQAGGGDKKQRLLFGKVSRSNKQEGERQTNKKEKR
jgi:hypothetical protein